MGIVYRRAEFGFAVAAAAPGLVGGRVGVAGAGRDSVGVVHPDGAGPVGRVDQVALEGAPGHPGIERAPDPLLALQGHRVGGQAGLHAEGPQQRPGAGQARGPLAEGIVLGHDQRVRRAIREGAVQGGGHVAEHQPVGGIAGHAPGGATSRPGRDGIGGGQGGRVAAVPHFHGGKQLKGATLESGIVGRLKNLQARGARGVDPLLEQVVLFDVR